VKSIDRFQYVRAGLRGLVAPVSLGASALATVPDGRVILVKHTYRSGWYLPGGGVMKGETAEAAAMRELAEETGLLRAGPPALFGFYLRRNGAHSDYIALYRVADAMIEFRPNAEIAEVVLADPHTPPADTSAGTLRRLAEFVTGTGPSAEW
jgi:8-oxo-dGTP pyrophosphatase MutT (NUDIX family)